MLSWKCRYKEEAIRHGVAYASCGHAFHPICLLEYEKHASQRAGSDQGIKCPLCRQTYEVRHFIPDDNLRSLCLEHTLHNAIVDAEQALKEADDKAKEAAEARNVAAQRAHHAVRLRQQAGPAFCSAAMASRLAALTSAQRGPPALPAPAVSAGGLAGPRMPQMLRTTTRPERSSTFTARPAATLGGTTRHTHNSPAAVAAAVVAAAPQPVDLGPGFDLGVHVPLHEQIATMRISAEANSLQMAAQHPEVVIGIEEPE